MARIGSIIFSNAEPHLLIIISITLGTAIIPGLEQIVLQLILVPLRISANRIVAYFISLMHDLRDCAIYMISANERAPLLPIYDSADDRVASR